VNLQLTTSTAEQLVQQRKVQCGITMTQGLNKFIMMVSFRNLGGVERPNERRALTLVYNVLSNELSFHPQPANNEEQEMANLFRAQQLNAGECCIWPCIRAILESHPLRE